MQKLIMKLTKKSQYDSASSTNSPIGLLWFLLHELNLKDVQYFIEWASNPSKYRMQYGNLTILDKENNIISISTLHYDKEDGGFEYFNVSVDQFIKLITEWQKLVEAGTEKITITEDSGQISIKGE